MPGHENGLRSVAFSPDSQHLLSFDAGGLIVQWPVRTGESEFPPRHRHEQDGSVTLGGHALGAELMRGMMAIYTPDGRTIVSAGQGRCMLIWDVATRQLRTHIQTGNNVYGFSITRDGREVALAEQLPRIEILDLAKPLAPRRPLQATRRATTRTVGISPSGLGRRSTNGTRH